MTNTLNNYKLVLVVPLVLISAMIAFTTTQFFLTHQSVLSSALTMDLVFSIPIIYYLLIRKKPISKFSVLTVMVVCISIASIIIPKNHQQLLSTIKYLVIPVSEILVLAVVLINALRFKNQFKTTSSTNKNFYERIQLTCKETFPNKFGTILATEIGMLYYFFSPNKKVSYQKNEFTYFKKNGIKELIGALVFIIIIETTATHLLIHLWSPLVANLCSLSSLYLIIMLIAIFKSTKHHPIKINKIDKTINLKYGFLNQSTIDIGDITSIEKSRKSTNQQLMKLSAFKDFDGHNVIIHLSKPQTMRKLYGMKKEFDCIGLYVDEPETFVVTVQMLMEEDTSN